MYWVNSIIRGPNYGRGRSVPLENGSTNSSPQSVPLNDSSSSSETMNIVESQDRTVIEKMSIDKRKDLTVEEVLSSEGPDTWENLSEFMRNCTIPAKCSNEPNQLESLNMLKNKKHRCSSTNKDEPGLSPASKRLKFKK